MGHRLHATLTLCACSLSLAVLQDAHKRCDTEMWKGGHLPFRPLTAALVVTVPAGKPMDGVVGFCVFGIGQRGQLIRPTADKTIMWKLSLCPHFDLHVTPRVTTIVPVEAVLPAWILGSVLQSHSDFALDLVVSRVPWPSPLVHVLISRVFGSHRDPADLSRSAGRACGGDQSSQKRRRPPGLPRQRRDDLPA